ncbi:MAG: alpha/beta fold hydrolase [Ktedonobacterales bacterium]
MPRFLSFDGIEIAYETWGTAGERPPVLLHHGFIANAEINWVRPGIVAALTQAGRQVVAIDARGHGTSAKPPDPAFYGEDKMVQDLRQLIDITGAEQVDLVGYSMGAIVSLSTASQDTRIRRLVVGGVGAGVVEAGGLDGRAAASATIIAALQAADPSTISQPIPRAFRTLADRVGGDREALAAVATARQVSSIPLQQITAPTLVIAGDSDPLAARPELLASAIPNAQLRLLPGDHLSVVLDPGFAAAIVEFLGA